MKKMDLHIHTLNTSSDNEFTFSKENFKEYIELNKLDCVAITNHNLFSKMQFDEICLFLNEKCNHECTILPGIELDTLSGHLLIIADVVNCSIIEGLSKYCVDNNIGPNNRINKNEIKILMADIKDELLLIPHIEKKPQIRVENLHELNIPVICGEVGSPKKWQVAMKNNDTVTPLLFSDIRISDDMSSNCSRYTYIDCETWSIKNIKDCLIRKKISLSNQECYFDIQGTKAHFGLNVVLGKRASGKSTLLKNIESENEAYHIKQFSLINKSEAFDNIQAENVKNIFDVKILPLEKFIECYIQLNNKVLNYNIDTYVSSLVQSAKEIKKDAYAQLPIYSAQKIKKSENNDLEKIYKNSYAAFNSKIAKNYFDQINTNDILAHIYIDLKKDYLNNQYIEKTNKLITSLKGVLSKKSSNTQIDEIELDLFFKKLIMEANFCNLISTFVNEEFENIGIFGYTRKSVFISPVYVKEINTNTKDISKTDITAHNKKSQYIELLRKLVEAGLNSKEIARCFLSYKTTTYNKNGKKLSGGEQTDYVLGLELEKASKYDTILIDEPESSFDNTFLHEDVCEKIKELSKSSTVFLATHNNTLGVSIKPDNFIFNEYDEINDKYSLKNVPFSMNINESLLISLMEGGNDAYKLRGEIYETTRN